ncbi:MAG: alpha-amylase family protein [Dysgonamonadaceae bacterium]|jgi:glycosidase|nr:alpha-amylase family protein [Dysgonamonadaceae bacterium]
MAGKKIFIYQLLPRLFGNKTPLLVQNGGIEQNGSGKFADLSDGILKKLKKTGYSHIWYTGVIAHASTTDYTSFGILKDFPEIVKGKAGSPYAIRDYYDVDPDLAVNVENRMQEFEELITRTHKAGLKVIMDFIPNHVARNYHSVCKPKKVKDFGKTDDANLSFSPQNNFYYLPGQALELQLPPDKFPVIAYKEVPAKVTGNDCFTNHPSQYDWYETVKLNYGVDYRGGHVNHFMPIPDTWLKMKEILFFWASKNMDGFRCDMAEMVPVEFWYWVIPQVKEKYPKLIFIAEIYNPTQYRDFLAQNSFDYLYDKVGLYDVLRDVACGYRPASDITFTLNSIGDIQSKMLNFMENHDEQRLASDFFLKDGAKGKAAMIVTACVNTNPVLIYSGQELGEKGMDEEGFSGRDGRTSIYDYWASDTVRRWNNNGKWNDELLSEDEKDLKNFYAKLIALCNKESALGEGYFYDLMPANYENGDFNSIGQFAFLRGKDKNVVLVVANFDHSEADMSVCIPEHAFNFFGVPKTDVGVATSLLADGKTMTPFSAKTPLKITVPPNSGEIYKISFLQ